MLTTTGIGYISYNAYPAAYTTRDDAVNDRFHTDGIDESHEKVNTAIGLVGVLANNATEREIHRRILEFELKRHRDHFAADIFTTTWPKYISRSIFTSSHGCWMSTTCNFCLRQRSTRRQRRASGKRRSSCCIRSAIVSAASNISIFFAAAFFARPYFAERVSS